MYEVAAHQSQLLAVYGRIVQSVPLGTFSNVHMLQVLKLDAQMQKLAEELKHENSLLVFGRGYNYATALEAALKVGFCHIPCG